MFCTQCGSSNSDRANFCYKCGVPTWQETAPGALLNTEAKPQTSEPTASVEPEIKAPITDSKILGVYGWLRFFCVLLGFLNPLIILGNIRAGYAEVAPFYAQYPQFRQLFGIEATSGVLTAGLGMMAAYLLWKRFASAVVFAKVYLVAVFFMSLVQLVALSTIQGFPPEVMSVLREEGAKGVAKAFVGCALWYCYLQFSSRVRMTYANGSMAGPLRQMNIPPLGAGIGLVLLTFGLYRWLYGV
ncbi:zinc ribbon domain-containing protein [Acidovorax facilis]|uniref:DUF2569 family protein n=1 Tax=Acidovorax facilis TaxID=12917 RepID=UPI00208EE05B|nr:DUF2569 family protein [Acidovorax facilis]MCO4240855.1 zinc ribbon domain-containing protein [Acidovorax facilis]